jgi:serine/threonine protein phosphatase 1
MSTIAIGDIHGHLAALEDLLAQIRPELGEGDSVVFLGDYIDRGPDSRGCVEAILNFEREATADVVCLLGNHEEWFLKTLDDFQRHSWLLGMEAFDTIQSYSDEASRTLRNAASNAGRLLYETRHALPYEVFFDRVPEPHLRFFERLRESHLTADCACTHAGVDPGIARFQDQPRRSLVWGHVGFPDRYAGAELVVYGHWSDAVIDSNGWPAPRMSERTIGVDTIEHGVLTAVRLPDRHVFQSARY